MMFDKIKNSPPIVKFLMKFISLMLLWKLVYTFVLLENGSTDRLLTHYVSEFSIKVLGWIGYPITSKLNEIGMYYFYLNGKCQLQIAHSCNGLILFVLFVAFLISFKGDWMLKIIVSIIGCIGIFLINVLRVVALMIVHMHWPQYLDFSHHWLFTAIVYGFVFSMWMLWINVFSDKKLIK
jgi:exosortase family protein XrtF